MIGNKRGNKIKSQIIQLISLYQIKLIKCLSLKFLRFFSSAPSMFTDSQPKTGTDSVPVLVDFGSNPKRFGRFTVSQIFKNGQNYSEPIFQFFKKDNCGTFEKYQQLRIGEYEFKKYCFLKNSIMDGELKLSEHPTQFDKNPCVEEVLQRCHKVREVSIGQNRRIYVTFIQYVQENPASINVQIRLFFRKENNDFKKATYVSYTLDEFKELIPNLNDFSNI